jgi:hypothetical protein
MNKNESVVVAAFSGEDGAEAAITHLQEWDDRVDEVKLGSILTVRMVDGVVESEVAHRGIWGSFFNRRTPIAREAIKALANELGSRIAVVVACDDFESSMVADILTKDGGKILASTSGRTAEESAKEEKEIADALTENAIRAAVEKAKLSPNRGYNEPE